MTTLQERATIVLDELEFFSQQIQQEATGDLLWRYEIALDLTLVIRKVMISILELLDLQEVHDRKREMKS
jgi:hypothetical protein